MKSPFRRQTNATLLLAAIGIFFACHLTQTETEETFTFPGLADSLSAYDSAYILLKNPSGETLDTLFHGKVTKQTNLKGLPAKDYNGGVAVISIEGYQSGKVVYQVEKIFDGSKDSVQTTRPVVLPDAAVKIDTENVKIIEGDSILLPRVVVTPADLKNKDLRWSSSQKSVLVTTATHLKALGPGSSLVSAHLVSDSSKWDTITIVVTPRIPIKKMLDSLRLKPDTVTVAVRGPMKQFKVEVYPDTAPSGVTYRSADTNVASISSEGWVKGMKAGLIRAFAESKADPKTGDSAWIEVLDPVPVAGVHFAVDSLELLAGGAAVRTQAEVLPDMANPKIQYFISDVGVAVLDSSGIRGLKAGRTSLIAKSSEDTGKSDTLTLIVLSGVPERPTVKGPVLPVNTLMPTWTWKGGGGGNGHFRYRLDSEDMSGAIETVDTFYTPLVNLTEQAHTLVVQEKNDSGKWSPSGRYTIRIDTTPPTPPKVSVNQSSPTSNSRPTWTWQGGPGDTYRYYRFKLDDDDFRSGGKDTTGTSYTPVKDLSDSAHVLYVQERDSAGNWSTSGSAPITIDTQRPNAPAVNVSPSTPTNDETPTWSWTTGGGGAGYRYKLNNANLDTGATETPTTAFTPTSGLGEGSFTLYVQERDAAGNWSVSGSKSVRIDLTPPAAPIIDSLPLSPLNSLRPKWTWKSGGGGAKVYRYRLDTADLVGAPSSSDTVFAPASDLIQGSHTLYVQEKDGAGNWSAVASRLLVLCLKEPVGQTGFSDSAVGSSTQIAVASDGTPYVLYLEGRRPIVKRYTNGSWVTVGDYGLNDDVTKVSLGMSPQDVPYIAYITSDILKVKKITGLNWVPEGNDNWVGGTTNVKLDFGKNGTPYIAFEDSTKKFTVLKLSGSTWDTIGTSGFAPSYSKFSASSSGQLYVAVNDYSGSAVRVFTSTGGGWTEMVTGYNFVSPWDLNLAEDEFGNIFISFFSDENIYTARVISYTNGVGWRPVGKEDAYYNYQGLMNIGIGGDGIPYLGLNGANGGYLLKKVGMNWIQIGTPFSDISFEDVAFAVSSSGVPYVAYPDPSKGNRLTVFKTGFNP